MLNFQPFGIASNGHLCQFLFGFNLGGERSRYAPQVDRVTALLNRAYKHGDGVVVEHRRSPRFEVHVPVIFDWVDESGTQRRGGGFTRDVSESGVFAWCEGECPPRGTNIRIALLLPGIEPTSKAWRMESTGRVVRTIDDVPEAKGFVATLDNLRAEALANGFR